MSPKSLKTIEYEKKIANVLMYEKAWNLTKINKAFLKYGRAITTKNKKSIIMLM